MYNSTTYSSVGNSALDHLARSRVSSHLSRAVDHISDDETFENINTTVSTYYFLLLLTLVQHRQRLRRLVRQDDLFGERHCDL
jgi:hypothetical protein